MRSQEIKFAKEVGVKLFGSTPDPRLQETDLGKRILELQSLYSEISADQFVTPGYGIPLRNEFETIPQDRIDEVANKIKEYTGDIQKIANDFFPTEINEVKETALNRVNLLKVIGR